MHIYSPWEAANNALALMNLGKMPEAPEWARTPLAKRPESASVVAKGLELTPPPIVDQQSVT